MWGVGRGGFTQIWKNNINKRGDKNDDHIHSVVMTTVLQFDTRVAQQTSQSTQLLGMQVLITP